MKIRRNILFYEYHELASSLRTEGVRQYIISEDGKVDSFNSEKKAGSVVLREGDKWILKRYFTNSQYPKHVLFEIRDKRLIEIMKIDENTELEHVEKTNLPSFLKELLIAELYQG